MTILIDLAALALGYLFGSVPFGLILTKIGGTQDLRSIGSGNIGATNVLRTGRKGLAAATLLGDALKGTAAVLLAGYLAKLTGAVAADAAMLAALGAFLGHLFPVWLKFKGGKGVATFLGTLIALHWALGLAACATWLVAAAVGRISSLSALVAAAGAVPLAFVLGDQAYMPVTALMAVLIFVRHRANIERILAGTEPKIGKKA